MWVTAQRNPSPPPRGTPVRMTALSAKQAPGPSAQAATWAPASSRCPPTACQGLPRKTGGSGESGQRLRQGDIYLPGSAGTVSPPIFTHQSRPTGMQGEGQARRQSAERGRDQCGCLPGPWWGLTKCTYQEPPSGNWGASFHLLISARGLGMAQRHPGLSQPP